MLQTRLLSPKNAVFKAKLSFCVIFQSWCKTTFSQNYLDFFSKTKKPLFGKQDGEISYSEPSLKLKPLVFPNMVKLAQSLTS